MQEELLSVLESDVFLTSRQVLERLREKYPQIVADLEKAVEDKKFHCVLSACAQQYFPLVEAGKVVNGRLYDQQFKKHYINIWKKA